MRKGSATLEWKDFYGEVDVFSNIQTIEPLGSISDPICVKLLHSIEQKNVLSWKKIRKLCIHDSDFR